MSNRIEAAAERLAELRRSIATVEALPDEINPQTIDESYKVQDALIEKLGGTIVGWKVGATGLEAQTALGVSEPFAGPLFAASHYSSPQMLPAAHFTNTLIECEFVFRLGKTLPPRPGQAYTRDDLHDAIDAVVPGVEIIAPSFKPAIGGDVRGRIADFAVSAGLVVGEPTSDWTALDLVNHRVRLQVDGDVVAEGTGEKVLGDPLNAMVWVANHLSERGRPLEAGHVVTTGTTTGIYELGVNRRAVADFGAFGTLELSFSS